VLSAADGRGSRRLTYEVLEAGHDPTGEDVGRFLGRLKAELDARGLVVKGVTTDGSDLYPAALAAVFPGVPHQLCRFHVLRGIIKAVLHAVAAARKAIKARIPKLPRGRRRKGDRAAAAAAREAARLRGRVAELFEHRHLFVRRRLSGSEGKTLRRVTRGQPHLRVLRGVMDEVYRLFDRRCRTGTALEKLARLRRRVRRFRQVGRSLSALFSADLEKALVFLNDKLLPSTSNAVERGNRRHRKMQKTVYSVRTQPHVRQRIALDLLREMNAAGRDAAIKTLHEERSVR
jgi:hypothetical protein